MGRRYTIKEDELEKLCGVFADPDTSNIEKLYQSALLKQFISFIGNSERRALFTLIEPKGAAVKLATELRKSKEYIRQMKEETLERLRVCLTAPWLSDFRVQALGEEIEKLPDVTYISWHEIQEGRKLSDDDKRKIMDLHAEGKAAGTIVELTGKHRSGVNYVLKHLGHNPYHERNITNKAYEAAFHESRGNSKAAAEKLGCSSDGIREKWVTMGLVERTKIVKKTKPKVIPDSKFRRAHKLCEGNAKYAQEMIGCELQTVYDRWKELGLITDHQQA
jgi:hypothetical protein